MSIQYGKCSFDGRREDPQDLDKVRPLLSPYGPDGERSLCKDNLSMVYYAFHTSKEARGEVQPHVGSSGIVLTWDGRLDNREELLKQLDASELAGSADVAIAGAAYEKWQTDSFAKLIGDWSLSIWNSKEESLTLARDFVGTRHLYYSAESDRVIWCTIMDPLVLCAGRSFELDEEYIAGWLSFFPASNRTPYMGIFSVPPSSYVRFVKGAQQVTTYWKIDPAMKVVYRKDFEYEEHFRSVFQHSVRRRLRSDSPVLAELSGGMDSSSIVCVADDILARDGSGTPRLDTVSYYDDSDLNWNERPYFEVVEKRRARKGCHINLASRNAFGFEPRPAGVPFLVSPAAALAPDESDRKFMECLHSNHNRVLLSGTGGDEVTGGVPTGAPELADLLRTAQLGLLRRQLKSWALARHEPWAHLLVQILRRFLPVGDPSCKRPPWLSSTFVQRHKRALSGYEERLKLWGPDPSLQENLQALDALRRQLGAALPSPVPYEQSYPYLDRDLVEFLYAIPREQLVRPGQRRSLMRRALRGIVPEEVLMRKRKAYATRQPAAFITGNWEVLAGIAESASSRGIPWIDSAALVKSMTAVQAGEFKDYLPLIRTILFEVWLESALALKHIQYRNDQQDKPREPETSSSEQRKTREKGGSNHAIPQAGNR
jgi:asparagine synthase (glutamine-hydrolysing)